MRLKTLLFGILLQAVVWFTPDMCNTPIHIASTNWGLPDYELAQGGYVDFKWRINCEDYDLTIYSDSYSISDQITIFTDDSVISLHSTGVNGEIHGYVEYIDGQYYYPDSLSTWPMENSTLSDQGKLKVITIVNAEVLTIRITLNSEANSHVMIYIPCERNIGEMNIPYCKDSSSYAIICNDLIKLNYYFTPDCIPTIFSPNGDGKNDTFKLNETFEIYDRWGNKLYRGKEWKGRVTPGVYIYKLDRGIIGQITVVK